MTKQLLTENGSATDLSAVRERESVLLRECWKSPEHKESVAVSGGKPWYFFLRVSRAKLCPE